jgi:hypothetical protein
LVLEGFLLAGEGRLVDGQALAAGGGRDIFFGSVGLFVEVFRLGGGEDLEVGEADLCVDDVRRLCLDMGGELRGITDL